MACALAIAAAAAFSCLAPRATVFLLVLVALAAAWVVLPAPGDWRRTLKTPVIATGGLLLLYMAASALWALDPAAAAAKVTGVAAVAGCALLAFAALDRLDRGTTERTALIFLAGAAAGALLVASEFATGQAITRLLFNLFPVLRPEGNKDLAVSDGEVFQIAHYELNRNIAVLVLTLWPALLVLTRQRAVSARLPLALAAAALTAILAFVSDHQTSMIAIVVGAAVLLAARVNARAVGRAVTAAWCLAFLLVIPASLAAYHKAELQHAKWLPSTARARIIIWNFTAEKVAQHPFLGIGVRSTRVLDAALLPNVKPDEGEVYAPRPGRHAHNLYLQSWFELGLIGAGLVMAFGLAILSRLAAVAEPLQPFGYALFGAVMVIAGLAWGMWQTWLLAAYALSALYLALGLRFDLAGPGGEETRPNR